MKKSVQLMFLLPGLHGKIGHGVQLALVWEQNLDKEGAAMGPSMWSIRQNTSFVSSLF